MNDLQSQEVGLLYGGICPECNHPLLKSRPQDVLSLSFDACAWCSYAVGSVAEIIYQQKTDAYLCRPLRLEGRQIWDRVETVLGLYGAEEIRTRLHLDPAPSDRTDIAVCAL